MLTTLRGFASLLFVPFILLPAGAVRSQSPSKGDPRRAFPPDAISVQRETLPERSLEATSPLKIHIEDLTSALSKSVHIYDPSDVPSSSKGTAPVIASPLSPMRRTRSSSFNMRMRSSSPTSERSQSPSQSPRNRPSRLLRPPLSPVTPTKGKEVLTSDDFSSQSVTSPQSGSSRLMSMFSRAKSPPFLIAQRYKGKQKVQKARSYKKSNAASIDNQLRMTQDHQKDRNEARSKLLSKSRNTPRMPFMIFGTNRKIIREMQEGAGSNSQVEHETEPIRIDLPQYAQGKGEATDSDTEGKKSYIVKGKAQMALRIPPRSFKKKVN